MQTVINIDMLSMSDAAETASHLADNSEIFSAHYNPNRSFSNILNKSNGGKKLLKKLSKNEDLSAAENNEFTRIIVNDLVEICGFYPSNSDKENAARAIVKQFPILGQCVCLDIPPHALWFDAKGSKDGKKAAGKSFAAHSIMQDNILYNKYT